MGPEGTKYIESRGLFLAACEKDDRGDKMRSALVIYEYGADESSYPGIQSVEDPDVQNGVPIPWGAMSGLAAGDGSTLYAVDDSAYKMSSIFSIDASSSPASLFKRTHITDANGVFAAVAPQGEFDAADLQAMINEDGTVNIDSEGIAVDPAGGFFVVSEGRGTVGDEDRPIESLNFLFKTDMAGVIEKVVVLPEEVNAIQLRFGFEGVAAEGDYVVVAFQRAWGDDTNPRIGLYNTVDESWKFLFYPLDERKCLGCACLSCIPRYNSYTDTQSKLFKLKVKTAAGWVYQISLLWGMESSLYLSETTREVLTLPSSVSTRLTLVICLPLRMVLLLRRRSSATL